MAIQVPQSTPNAPQAVNPFGIAEAYLNRNQTQQQLFNSALGGLGSTVNELRQQKLQNQLAALNAYAKIAETSGITAANQMAPNIPGWGGINTQNLPQDPFAQMGNLPPVEPAQPSQPAGTNGVQSGNPSQAIQLSSQMGHPDVAGTYPRHVQGVPDLPTLSPQMAQNNAIIQKASRVGGSFASNIVKNLSAVNTGLAAQDTAMQAPVKFAQEQANFQQGKTQEANQFATTKQQELNTKREQIEKEYQDQNKSLATALNVVGTSLSLKRTAGEGMSGPVVGNASSTVANASSGKFAKPVYNLNQFNTLNSPALQHSQDINRFNPQEVQSLKASGLSLPGEPLQTSEGKAQIVQGIYLKRMIQNVKEKEAKLAAQGIPSSLTPHDQQAMAWAQTHANDPRAVKMMLAITGNTEMQ